MEKTCAAEKKRTTDNMRVEKKKKRGSTQNRKQPNGVLKRTGLRRDG